MTPAVMIVIMPTSFQVGFSSLNMNANSNTKASDDDLHMAEGGWSEQLPGHPLTSCPGPLTIEREGDCSETEIRQTNVETCCHTTRSDFGSVTKDLGTAGRRSAHYARPTHI